MKEKLTVTIDEDLIPVAKQYAGAKGKSLSALIEDLLRKAANGKKAMFSERWRGKFSAAAKADNRFEYLSKKYL